MNYPCIICGRPRDGGRIWCGDDECLKKVVAMPVSEINAVREKEAIEAMARSPPPADGAGVYVHFTPRPDEE